VQEDKIPRTQLTILLPTEEKTLIVKAARACGYRSLSDFIRKAALEKAAAETRNSPIDPVQNPSNQQTDSNATLFANIGIEPDIGSRQPAAAFPSIRNFATVFSDRNRAMMRHLAAHEPRSITELSDQIGYPYTGLHRNLSTLAGYGVIGYRGGGTDGQHLSPYLRVRSVLLTIAFVTGTVECGHFLRLAVQDKDRQKHRQRDDQMFKSMTELPKMLPEHALDILCTAKSSRGAAIDALQQKLGVSRASLYQKIDKLRSNGLLQVVSARPLKVSATYDGITVRIDLAENDIIME
jgi:predicted transcriptional regulator